MTRVRAVLSGALVLLLWPATGTPQIKPPYLRKQGSATQLIVEGKPFLGLAGELGNNTATSLENMQSVWPRLVAANLNCVLIALSWAQIEPEEGKYDFSLVDGLLAEARRHNLKVIFLWFGSWKNGLSSYAPLWVKRDYKRFPRVRLQNNHTLELLSPFSEQTRDADARAFRVLMRHIRDVDAPFHTVIAMQVENEVGILRDTRDRSEAANRAFRSQVPKELIEYMQRNRQSLVPEFREVWAASGYKTSGSWEEVFGPGKPDNVEIPLQTTSPPLSREEFETGWRRLHWPVDEIFMAWHYARFINKIAEEGKAEYNIPMFVNAWLQQPSTAWPGTYPSGGPVPQVHDVWRAGAPAIDILAPDIYIPFFDEVCERFIRAGNPLMIPETRANSANALMAFGRYGAMLFSPFAIERAAGPDTDLALTYRLLADAADLITSHQGKDSMTAIRLAPGDPPRTVRLGNYSLRLTYHGRGRIPIAPEPPKPEPPKPASSSASSQQVPPAASPGQQLPAEMATIAIAAGPDEYYFIGGGMRIDFLPETPGPRLVGLGLVQEGRFVNRRWVVQRQLGGDDTGQGEFLIMRPNTILRVVVYRYE